MNQSDRNTVRDVLEDLEVAQHHASVGETRNRTLDAISKLRSLFDDEEDA